MPDNSVKHLGCEDILANLTIEELEERLEMQVARIPEADCAWSCSGQCDQVGNTCAGVCDPDSDCGFWCYTGYCVENAVTTCS